jgi:phospholipid/cholesterol/gamma-HCH transport system substrate-binding protein
MSVIFELDKRGELPPENVPPARRERLSPRRRRQVLGAIALVVFAAIVVVVVLAYNQVFSPGVPATVVSAEAGLLMQPGADVTLDGVTIGRVTSITPVGNQARIGISVDPSQVGYIPTNVQAQILMPTVFGPKYLNLVVPAHPAAERMQAGQVIEPTASATEIDTVFANLVSVLDTVNPAKLSATLGAISTALQGRGQEIGSFVVQLNSYLKEFNPALPAVGKDLSTIPPVANTYTAAAPDLIKTLDNLRVTSGTIVSQQAQFDALLVDLSGFSSNAQSFLSSNGKSLENTLATLLPTDNLVSYYSPEFPCLFASINQINKISITDNINLNTAIIPGSNPYTYPSSVPVVKASGGPSCYGGPLTPATAATWPRLSFDDGTASISSNSLSYGKLALNLFGSSGASDASSAAKNAAQSASDASKGK